MRLLPPWHPDVLLPAMALVVVAGSLWRLSPAVDSTLADSPHPIAGFLAQEERRPPADPVRLLIPSIEVDAPIEHVGLTDAGEMEPPVRWEDAAWYAPGIVPGMPGNAVIAGHLDSDTGPAVFWRLGDLRPGDAVEVIDAAGKRLRFRVREVRRYDEREAPLEKIFGPGERRGLNLITCAGSWDDGRGEYAERMVVYTELEE